MQEIYEYKKLQEQSEILLDSFVEDIYKIFGLLLVIIEGYNISIKDRYIKSLLHNAIVLDERFEITIEIGRKTPFYRFSTDIPLNLLFSSDEKVLQFWQSHNRVKYFLKKFYQPE